MSSCLCFFFFFNDTATTEMYTYSFPTRRSSDLTESSRAFATSESRRSSHGWRDGPGRRRPAPARHNTRPSAPDSHGFESRSEEHTSELQSLMHISYAVFCLKKKKTST